jgi:hypothetical protein
MPFFKDRDLLKVGAEDPVCGALGETSIVTKSGRLPTTFTPCHLEFLSNLDCNQLNQLLQSGILPQFVSLLKKSG